MTGESKEREKNNGSGLQELEFLFGIEYLLHHWLKRMDFFECYFTADHSWVWSTGFDDHKAGNQLIFCPTFRLIMIVNHKYRRVHRLINGIMKVADCAIKLQGLMNCRQ